MLAHLLTRFFGGLDLHFGKPLKRPITKPKSPSLSNEKVNQNWHKDHRDKRAKLFFQFASEMRLVYEKINGAVWKHKTRRRTTQKKLVQVVGTFC